MAARAWRGQPFGCRLPVEAIFAGIRSPGLRTPTISRDVLPRPESREMSTFAVRSCVFSEKRETSLRYAPQICRTFMNGRLKTEARPRRDHFPPDGVRE